MSCILCLLPQKEIYAATNTCGGEQYQSVAYRINTAHTGVTSFTKPITFPMQEIWKVKSDGDVSYPLITEGKVFFTTSNRELFALALSTGKIVWGPIALGGLGPASLAYDDGKVFANNSIGILKAVNASSGKTLWIALGYTGNSAPTAKNGIIYVSGNGVVNAIDEKNGETLWSMRVNGADADAPAVTSEGIYVSYFCSNVYKFNPKKFGQLEWHYGNRCSGAGGVTPIFSNGRLYVIDPVSNNIVIDTETGTVIDSFQSNAYPPAISKNRGYFIENGVLRAKQLRSSSILWSFEGDGRLNGPPIKIDQHVFVLSQSNNLYALESRTGQKVWEAYLGQHYLISGALSAGEDALIVVTGKTLTAFR